MILTIEFPIAVKQLNHITHDKEIGDITRVGEDEYYRLFPSRKVGKAHKWDGTPMGESFRDDFLHCYPLPPPNEQFYKYISDWEIGNH